MRGRWVGLGLLGALALGVSAGTVRAEEETSLDSELVVTKEGDVRFLSLRDWPVTRTDGVVRPAPLEEYLSLKFGQVSRAFDELAQRVEGLERRLEELGAAHRALEASLRALEAYAAKTEVTHGHAPQDTETAPGPSGESP